MLCFLSTGCSLLFVNFSVLGTKLRLCKFGKEMRREWGGAIWANKVPKGMVF